MCLVLKITSACKYMQALDAERTGFEPVKPFRGLHAFQACLFNHSSIFPVDGNTSHFLILRLQR